MDFRGLLPAALCFAAVFTAGSSIAEAQTPPKKAAPAAKPAAPAAKPAAGAAKPATASAATAHTGATTTTANKATTTTATRTTTTTSTAHTATTAAGHTEAPGGSAARGAGAGGLSANRAGGVPGVRSGGLAHAGPAGSHDHVSPNGNVMRTRANGRPMDVHDARRGMDIHHNLAGGRRVEVERADHSRLVYERGRPGFISHPYMFHGHEYARRSYYYNGRAYDRYYNHYGYRGVYLDVYAPARFYGVGFYGWAANPWAAPVAYGWGWGGAPWYGYYGAYFTPYPVYAAPSLWLTDYLIAQSLQTQYAARQAAAADAAAQAEGAAPPAPLTPETKALVAEEVKRQIALENAEAQANAQHQENEAASSSIARILGDGQPHVFVAGKELDVTDAQQHECAVTDGDVLQLAGPPPANTTSATLVVLSSKGGMECGPRSTVTVAFEDLQEMQNHMRETVDQGLAEMQAKQGKGGLPAAPASALAPPVTAAIAESAPPVDPAGAKELADQAQQADQAEQEVVRDTATGGPSDAGAPAAPAPTQTISVELGQTEDQVKTALGQPTKIMNLGPKVIFVYKDMKVTFKGGKVTDVE